MVGSFDSENSFHYNMEEDTSWDKVIIIFLLGMGVGGGGVLSKEIRETYVTFFTPYTISKERS